MSIAGLISLLYGPWVGTCSEDDLPSSTVINLDSASEAEMDNDNGETEEAPMVPTEARVYVLRMDF